MDPTTPDLEVPTRDELLAAQSWESVDRVKDDPGTSAFKAAARLHQARWRAARGYPIGTQPLNSQRKTKNKKTGEEKTPRAVGSNVELEYARQHLVNFLGEGVRQAVTDRLGKGQRQRHEMLNDERLYASLLSSMPMCFNLFGGLGSLEQITNAVKSWWPDVPGSVTEVIFEWSPGRLDPQYLGNRSAFDVAFLLDLGGGRRGVIGVETKYHEHAVPVAIKPERVARYREVAEASGVFDDATIGSLLAGPHTEPPSVADPRSQIWLDHLLALSMLQHPSAGWEFARFVIVYPDANPSWSTLAGEYQALVGLGEPTFGTASFDQLLAAGVYTSEQSAALVERYRCWTPVA